jgi:hypothetical protein
MAPDEAFAVEAARRLGLELDAASRGAVAANLALLRAMAAEFDALELDERSDPAELLSP